MKSALTDREVRGGGEAERERGKEAERERGREGERERGREGERQRGREAERERQRGREERPGSRISRCLQPHRLCKWRLPVIHTAPRLSKIQCTSVCVARAKRTLPPEPV